MGALNRRRAAVKKREVADDKRPKHWELHKTAASAPSLAERVRRLENRVQYGSGGGVS